jgi:oligopeptide transport system substrate-binding protein
MQWNKQFRAVSLAGENGFEKPFAQSLGIGPDVAGGVLELTKTLSQVHKEVGRYLAGGVTSPPATRRAFNLDQPPQSESGRYYLPAWFMVKPWLCIKWMCLLVICAAQVVLTACQEHGEHLLQANRIASRRLVWESGGEPASLDPVFQVGMAELYVEDALFAGLVRAHPVTLEPMAEIATHYERNIEATRYVFYLRGHPHPRGIALDNADTLRKQFESGLIPEDLARGRTAPPDTMPARWSDGEPVTADDFVYSWRRLYDPKTASPNAESSTYILNASEIVAGKLPVTVLGVRALDQWTLEVLLARPCGFLLDVLDFANFDAVPRKAIEAAERGGAPRSWTDPGRIVTNGAFLLSSWKPFEKIVVTRNPNYWDAEATTLNEIEFVPIRDDRTNMDLFEAGDADFMRVPFTFVPALEKRKDYSFSLPSTSTFVAVNVSKPPLDNPLLRCALNMATDKHQLALLANGTAEVARTPVISTRSYVPPAVVFVEARGRKYDVSSYDPVGARELLAAAGFPGGKDKDGLPLRLPVIYTVPGDESVVDVLAQQWQNTLGIEINPTRVESSVYVGTLLAGQYSLGLGEWTDLPEPTWYFNLLFLGDNGGGTYWKSADFNRLMAEAKATPDQGLRMKKLTECDRIFMQNMPLIPLTHRATPVMIKPYLIGVQHTLETRFKYIRLEKQ